MMKLRERTDDEPNQAGPPSPDGAGNEGLRRARAAGHTLLAAGADAIQKALSGNSESFLAAARQQGGQ